MKHRAAILDVISDALTGISDREYKVRKGFVAWLSWDWEQFPIAASIRWDEAELKVDVESASAHTETLSAVLTIELFTCCERRSESEDIDDERMQELSNDLTEALVALGSHRLEDGSGLVSGFTDVRTVEANQEAPRIQGLICILGVAF